MIPCSVAADIRRPGAVGRVACESQRPESVRPQSAADQKAIRRKVHCAELRTTPGPGGANLRGVVTGQTRPQRLPNGLHEILFGAQLAESASAHWSKPRRRNADAPMPFRARTSPQVNCRYACFQHESASDESLAVSDACLDFSQHGCKLSGARAVQAIDTSCGDLEQGRSFVQARALQDSANRSGVEPAFA